MSFKDNNEIAIKLDSLSKCFQIYNKPHHRLIQGLIGVKKQYFKEFWALKDVSFEIRKGEAVGIIGRNGSGKSTLLQIICGTLASTSGKVDVNGRVAALLELGAGFNPEFTGRENVYMNAAILGLSRDEIDAKYDDIVAFADIGEFVEQPVKTYSSGMMVRLAFAVAINVDPEILIVDEALSVGDELFQRKCFSRIETIRASGATILFVSHSGAQIIELCDRAILMDSGEKLAVGIPKQMVGRYQQLLYAPADKREAIREQIRHKAGQFGTAVDSTENKTDGDLVSDLYTQEQQERFDPELKSSSTIEYESQGAYIESPAVLTLAGERVNNLISGKTYRYTYAVRFTESVSNVRFGMLIKTISGVELGGATSDKSSANGIMIVKKGALIHVEYRFTCLLNPGMYFLNAGVSGNVLGEVKHLHRIIDAFCFRVVGDFAGYSTGIIDFACFPEIFLDNIE
jgi:lipopolysaccharide transport system ATP-binding protein